MKHILMICVMALGMSASAQNSWSVDKLHSSVNFEVDHMMFSTVNGKFKTFDMQVSGSASETDFSNAKVNATIEVASIDTDNKDRNEHLKSPDFFDAASHPQIRFESSSFKSTGKNEYEITGNITVRGTTKPITFKATLLGGLKDSKGKVHAGWRATTVLNRLDFGLKWNQGLEAGGVLVGEEVTITVFAELIQN